MEVELENQQFMDGSEALQGVSRLSIITAIHRSIANSHGSGIPASITVRSAW